MIVTGTSRGIERSAARRLATDGFTIVVNYSAMPPAEEVVAETSPVKGNPLPCRLCGKCSRRGGSLFKEAMDTFGEVSVVVNCAGIIPQQIDMSRWRKYQKK